jgi:opacity protein-like surface antigen
VEQPARPSTFLKESTMKKRIALLASLPFAIALPAQADEHLLGYVAGAETLPQGASDAYFFVTRRWDKGQGDYTAYDTDVEYEYGVTNRLTATVALKGQSIDASGLVIDGYLPGAENYGTKPSGVEAKLKYNFLSAAKDPVGLSGTFSLKQNWLDPHSGKDKDTTKADFALQLQKLLLDDQLTLIANTGIEATYAKRAPLDAATQASADASMQALTGDPAASFEWPTEPEMEIEFRLGAGASYRFAPSWSVGVETLYQTEFETEVGQERWSWFAGPSIHYGGKQWWATLTWFEQIAGGKEQYINQADSDLHLIEKTEHELRFKLGYNF